MAARADGGSLHRAAALVPSLASVNPCAQPATQLLTLPWKDSLRSWFSVPLSRFSFLFSFVLLCLMFSLGFPKKLLQVKRAQPTRSRRANCHQSRVCDANTAH